MTALERTLDTLFGDMDDLLSDNQKSTGSFFNYEGEIITEPLEFKDKTAITIDLAHKFTLMFPGITITDTEFIQSGYFTFQFPNIGPYQDIEFYVRPNHEQEGVYELSTQWQGYAQTITHFTSRYVCADDFIYPIQQVLGRLFITCYHGLCAYHNLEPFTDDFPLITCTNIESQPKKFKSAQLTLGDGGIYNYTVEGNTYLTYDHQRDRMFSWQEYQREMHLRGEVFTSGGIVVRHTPYPAENITTDEFVDYEES